MTGMNLRRAYAVFLRYMMLLRGSPQRVFQIVVWGALDLVLWGFLTKYLAEIGGATLGIIPTLLGAVIFLEFTTRAHQGTSTPALEDIWSNNLLNYFASPLKIGEYILGLFAASVVTSALSLAVLLAVALFAFGFTFSIGLVLLGYLAVLFIFGIALGVFGVCIVLRFGPSGEWWVWPLTALLSPFMGVFYPLAVLPEWMQTIGYLLPPTYVFEGMRAILLGTESPGGLLLGFILSLVYLALSYGVFALVFRSVVRSGMLSRHSAESV